MEEIKRKAELDPDYNEIPDRSVKRIKIETDEDSFINYERIVQVFQREFQKEIFAKREEVHKIQQQLLKAQKTLHLLKYVVVKSFYESKELKLTNANEVPVLPSTSNASNNSVESFINLQNRIHPAVKKLIGKKPINYEPYRTRKKNLNPYAHKNVIRRGENITIKEDDGVDNIKTEPMEEEKPLIDTSRIKIERKEEEVFPIRNRDKNKYCIVVGNISKWMPSTSAQDNSTHKWMVYVRGPKENPDISHIVKKVRFFLHPSYQPNDIVDVQEAPFHLSRRGWGEFPLRVQIHFKVTENKTVDIIHNIKLDRTYSGRQTMGGETIVNVWIYDKEFGDESDESKKINFDSDIFIKQEYPDEIFEEKKYAKDFRNVDTPVEIPPEKCSVANCDKLADFINCCEESLKVLGDVEGDKKAIYEETQKPQLLIMDSITQVDDYIEKNEQVLNGFLKNNIFDNQETVLSSIGVTEIELSNKYSQEICEDATSRDFELIYLEDHCYTKLKEPTKINQIVKPPKYVVGKNNWTSLDANYLLEKDKYKIEVPLENFKTISQIVYYFFKNLPLVTELAKETSYICSYPYAASSMEQFQSWNPTKQFCAEWYRAKHIKKFLTDNNLDGHQEWTTKIILIFGQAHGFSCFNRCELFHKKTGEAGKSVPNHCSMQLELDTYTEAIPLKELLDLKHTVNQVDENDVDIINTKSDLPKAKEIKNPLNISLSNEESTLPYTYIKETARQVGINLQSEEIEGVHIRASEKIILKSVMCLAEELIRKALANNNVENKINSDKAIDKNDIFNVLTEREEFSIFLNHGLGKSTTL